jgi:hypothetical protein
MTQPSVLSAGIIIFGASLVLDGLGRMKKMREDRVFEGEGVNLDFSDNITER